MWYVFFIALLVTFGAIALAVLSYDFQVMGVITAIVAACVVLGVGIGLITKSVQHVGCRSFAHNSGYQTAFREWNAGWSWACFAKTKSGQWLPKEQLRGFNG